MDELLDTLDAAMEARVVSDAPAGPGQLRFAHVLIRDALYEGLTTARRVRLHRPAEEAVESLYGYSGSHLAELAHHAIAGSDFEKTLICAQQAAERALGLLAFEEAARLSRTALDSLELARPADDEVRCAPPTLARRGGASSWESRGLQGDIPRSSRNCAAPRTLPAARSRRERLRGQDHLRESRFVTGATE